MLILRVNERKRNKEFEDLRMAIICYFGKNSFCSSWQPNTYCQGVLCYAITFPLYCSFKQKKKGHFTGVNCTWFYIPEIYFEFFVSCSHVFCIFSSIKV